MMSTCLLSVYRLFYCLRLSVIMLLIRYFLVMQMTRSRLQKKRLKEKKNIRRFLPKTAQTIQKFSVLHTRNPYHSYENPPQNFFFCRCACDYKSLREPISSSSDAFLLFGIFCVSFGLFL